MRGFGYATILIPSFHDLCKERLGPQRLVCVLNTKKNRLQIMSLAAYASETNYDWKIVMIAGWVQ